MSYRFLMWLRESVDDIVLEFNNSVRELASPTISESPETLGDDSN